MTGSQAFALWAPDDDEWALWAKPVLFSLMDELKSDEPPPTAPAVDIGWAPGPDRNNAIVVELPGVAAVAAGLLLARRGYRPVPLFNATSGPNALLDVATIARHLQLSASLLATLPLSAEAPPCFLLDSERMRPPRKPGPGVFDNRWIVFPQDFPSATRLRARGIEDVIVAMKNTLTPAEDLSHVLLRWQQGGIRIHAVDVDVAEATPAAIEIKPPSRFRRAWYRLGAISHLHRSSTGGFGAFIPYPTSGG